MKTLFTGTFIVFLLFFSQQSLSDTDLFISVENVGGGVSPPPIANALYDVEINFEELKAFPQILNLDLPDSLSSAVPVMSFDPRSGFILRDDETDPPGTPPFWPNPNLNPEDFSYMWYGHNDDFDVVLTVHNGQMIGMIAGNNKSFGIELIDGQSYRMIDIYQAGFPPMHGESYEKNGFYSQSKPDLKDQTDNTYTTHLKSYDLDKNGIHAGKSDVTTLDMLIVWIEQARIDAGGSPTDPNDTQGIETLIMNSVDNANAALSQSLTNTRVTKFHTAKLENFVTVTNDNFVLFENLQAFENLQSVKTLRTDVGADIVTGIVQDYDDSFYACGIANVQTYPTCVFIPPVPQCDDAAAFEDYSYNLVSQKCAVLDNTFTHELGHLLGANHPRDASQLPPGWQSDVIANGYPYAFGRWIPSTFSSIMTIAQPTTSRRLFYSNPDVSILINNVSTPTGIIGTSNNARVIDELTPVMSTYRTRPDLIFIDGFE